MNFKFLPKIYALLLQSHTPTAKTFSAWTYCKRNKSVSHAEPPNWTYSITWQNALSDWNDLSKILRNNQLGKQKWAYCFCLVPRWLIFPLSLISRSCQIHINW